MEYIPYKEEKSEHEIILVRGGVGARPTILIAHAWSGRDAFVEEAAHRFAELGFTACALDIFGREGQPQTREEKEAAIAPFIADRTLTKHRMTSALEKISAHEGVDKGRIGAIGFCFGGLCVLDLARAGAPIRAAISVHGLLAKAPHDGSIKPAVLALHGDLDPMVSEEQVKGWCDEMRASGASWQLHTFGGVFHAFTNPEANDRESGLLYDEKAATLSWQMIDAFFERSV